VLTQVVATGIDREVNLVKANLVAVAGLLIYLIVAKKWHQRNKGGYRNEETSDVVEYIVRGRSDRDRRASCHVYRCDGWFFWQNRETTHTLGSAFSAPASPPTRISPNIHAGLK
jgi:hypothetical protein